MVSEHLELQLKPNHNVYDVRRVWSNLLEKYAITQPAERQNEEPIIVFRRNVMLSKRRQREVNASKGNKAIELFPFRSRIETKNALHFSMPKLDKRLFQGVIPALCVQVFNWRQWTWRLHLDRLIKV